MADELAPGGSDLGGGGDAGAPAGDTPSYIDLKEDSLIKAPGLDKPVAYKDYIGGYVSKSDLTRMRQQDAQQLQRDRQALHAQETQLKSAAAQLAQRLTPTQAGQPDPFGELATQPYIDGKTFAGTMKSVLQAVQQNNQRYEQTIGLLHQRLQRAEQGFSTLNGRTQQADLQKLFESTRTKLGLPENEQVKALIESEYWAHEGWDTVSPDERVEQLSAVVKQRYEGLQQVWKAGQQERVNAARQRTSLPAQGGMPKLKGSGGRGQGFKSAEDLANELYPMLGSGSDT